MGNLLIQTQPLDTIREKYLENMSIETVGGKSGEPLLVWQNEMKKLWPESQETVFERGIICAKSLKNIYKSSNKKLAHIIVTHGKMV